MGMMKQYLLNLITSCSDEQFGQDAVEWAIMKGHIQLTYNLDADLRLIMGEPGKPETGAYPSIVEAFQRTIQHEWSDEDAPLLSDLLKSAA